MSLRAISKHLKVLERAGLIERGRETQWRPCRLNAKPLRDVAHWVEQYRRFWEQSFDAPRSLVFKAWTDPKHVGQWWGPHGFTNPVCELDVRPGGAIRIHMCGPDGTLYPMTGVYREIVEPERLVFTSAALDNEGKPLFEVLNTVTFAEQGSKTILTLQARVVKSTAEAAPYLEGMEAGWTQSLERLAEYVSHTC